ncbi:MAG: VWA domain-containing protein [Polyangiales bacterium]
MTGHRRYFLALSLALTACGSPLVLNPPPSTDAGDAAVGDDTPAVDVPVADDVPTTLDVPAVDVPSQDVPAVDVPTPTDVPVTDVPVTDVPTPTDVPAVDGGGACTGTAQCPGGQVCDTSARRCVECLTGTQCTGTNQVCVGQRCVTGTPCMSSRTCTGLVCDTARGVCVECLGDVDCASGQRCRANACAPVTECRSSRECSAGGQVCETTRGVCVDCAADTDCTGAQFCDAENFCRPRVCVPSAATCVDLTHVRECDARGTAEATRACAMNESCAAGRCQTRVCSPGATSCASATQIRTCNADGLGFTAGMTCPAGQTCSSGACTACDMDGDGDDDGISDADERAAGTDPCLRDSDGDGATDLVERVAGTNPRLASSRPDGEIIEAPYRTDGGGAVNREVSYQSRAVPLDVMFVIDTTGSMGATLSELRTGIGALTTRIRGVAPEARFGVTEYRDFANGASGDSSAYAFNRRLRMAQDISLVQNAINALSVAGGGDGPEALTPSLYALLEGRAFSTYGGSFNRDATAADCGGDATAYGWACFLPGRTPVFIAYSDADTHNGPGEGNFYFGTPMAPLWNDLVGALQRRDARYIGVDVSGTSSGRLHLRNSNLLSTATDTVNATGQPLSFVGSAASTADQIVSAVGAIAGAGTPDITARVLANTAETRLPTGRTTADFVRAVNSLRGAPEAPAGYARREGAVFYGVVSGTRVFYNLVLRNDFVAATASDQVYVASLLFTGSGVGLERRALYIVIPAN